MNREKYNQLSELKQLTVLDEYGVLIGERESRFYHIKLYQVENFYVEVYFHTHFNVAVNIHSFTDTDYLEPYLQTIDVEPLIYAQ